MPRVKRSVAARKKRRKVLEQAKGYWGLKNSHYTLREGAGRALARLRLPRPQEQEAHVPAPLDRPHQRRGAAERPLVQPVHVGRAQGRDRARPQVARRHRGLGSRCVRRSSPSRPRPRSRPKQPERPRLAGGRLHARRRRTASRCSVSPLSGRPPALARVVITSKDNAKLKLVRALAAEEGARRDGAVRLRGRGSLRRGARCGDRARRAARRRRERRAGAARGRLDPAAPAARDRRLPLAPTCRGDAGRVPRALAPRRPGQRRHADPLRGRLRRGGLALGGLRRPASRRRRCARARARSSACRSSPGTSGRGASSRSTRAARSRSPSVELSPPVTFLLGAEREGLPRRGAAQPATRSRRSRCRATRSR